MAEISQPEAKAAGAAIANGTDKVKIGTSFYYLEASGGSGLKFYWMQQEMGSVKCTLEEPLAKVQEININPAYQRQGLGKLLAACMIGFCQAKGVTSIRLGTQDTSGGFWSKFQISTANSKTINELWIMLGPVIDVPRKPAVKEVIGFDRSKKSMW
jgi:GNAT superfamily N-acetyltransferase